MGDRFDRTEFRPQRAYLLAQVASRCVPSQTRRVRNVGAMVRFRVDQERVAQLRKARLAIGRRNATGASGSNEPIM
jgi:hypothetical protein